MTDALIVIRTERHIYGPFADSNAAQIWLRRAKWMVTPKPPVIEEVLSPEKIDGVTARND